MSLDRRHSTKGSNIGTIALVEIDLGLGKNLVDLVEPLKDDDLFSAIRQGKLMHRTLKDYWYFYSDFLIESCQYQFSLCPLYSR
jgi:hypothetical protein